MWYPSRVLPVEHIFDRLLARLILSVRLDILIHAKEIVRVVHALHSGEAVVVRSPLSRAKFTPRTTSGVVAQRAMIAGRLSIIASNIPKVLGPRRIPNHAMPNAL